MRHRSLSSPILATLLGLSIFALPTVSAQDADAKKAPSDPIGYFLGLSVGQQMSQNGFKTGDFDVQAMVAGFQDGMGQKESALSDEQLLETQKKIQAMLTSRREQIAKAMKAKGEAFLTSNAKKEGIKTLESGLQYKVLEAGDGDAPGPTDTVQVHYTGKLIDGTVFDSSVERGQPATFRVNQVIKGWQEGLQKMKTGSKWMLYIPSDLGYGAQGSPGAIGPHQVLVFEVELLKIQ